MNTSPVARAQAADTPSQAQRQPAGTSALPEFLLSTGQPCVVELITDCQAQTQPSKTRAELLADGQCEV